MNIAELAVKNIEKFGEYESLIFNENTYTNVELHNKTLSLAHGLVKLGVKHGDRVGMVMANCPEVMHSFGACFMTGAWAMPVVFVLTAEQMIYIFKDSEAEAVITHAIFLDKMLEVQKQV